MQRQSEIHVLFQNQTMEVNSKETQQQQNTNMISQSVRPMVLHVELDMHITFLSVPLRFHCVRFHVAIFLYFLFFRVYFYHFVPRS
eukprot:m.96485 g.96485  ORF g.96485 m.96485 type:complete len:86 (-) comp26900_c0_seq3:1105-1362(-)